jgi:anti-anti-sigma regulatory factor
VCSGCTFTVETDLCTAMVRAAGTLNDQTSALLIGAVNTLRRRGCRSITLDIGGLDTIAPAGAQALALLQDRVRADGGLLAVYIAPSPAAPSSGSGAQAALPAIPLAG